MTSLTLLPAVDIAEGRADQVVGTGDTDPAGVAAHWVDRGATWLHVVDLDRARGRADNDAVIGRLVAGTPVPVQLSGGIADEAALSWALGTGAARVTLASTALLDLDWVGAALRRHGDRIAVGLDVRGPDVVARGVGTHVGGVRDLVVALTPLPVHTYVVADATRDGSRQGTDLGLFSALARELRAPVIAAGGVGSLEDLRGLRSLSGAGVQGAVLGAALYHGAFTLEQALAAVRQGEDDHDAEEGTG